jgi:hypothetical protein
MPWIAASSGGLAKEGRPSGLRSYRLTSAGNRAVADLHGAKVPCFSFWVKSWGRRLLVLVVRGIVVIVIQIVFVVRGIGIIGFFRLLLVLFFFRAL